MEELEPVPQPIPQVGQVLTSACLCSWQNREKGVEGEGGVKQQAWSLGWGWCPTGLEAGQWLGAPGGKGARNQRRSLLLSCLPLPLTP